MTTYTWTSSRRWCDAAAHAEGPTCADCDTDTPCAGCGVTIAAGTLHMVCDQNGEVAHRRCTGAAEAQWVDYY
ncbi:MAG TPA: hypothetical protein VFR67_05995 [Pilimelia sp.]|nr:hypothetical protein [Pilimelia sp.]